MKANTLRQKYLEFFKTKKHSIIPSASIMPDNDPTTLFTGSGMQPMLPYLLGEKHPKGTRLVDSQKSFRAPDIEDVGDNRHTTFFEMLGNWSLGDYFKKEQIEWMFEFLTKELGLDPNRIYTSVFRGDEKIGIPKDDETVKLWQERFESVGVEARAVDMAERDGMQGGRIFYYDAKENWWSRSGVPDNMPVGEPGGPDSEMFWDFGVDLKIHENSEYKDQPCHPACDCGRFLEIGNNVFMSYIKTDAGFEELEKKNIDFGGGLERMVVAVLDNPDVFMSDLFEGMKIKIEELTGKKYGESEEVTYAFRVILDHLRGATFIIGDDKGVTPSNTDQGYIVRRLIRRAIRYGKQLGITQELWLKEIAKVVIEDYKGTYSELERNKDFVLEQLDKEEIQFSKTLEKGLRELEKGTDPFVLFTTYGFPIEMTQELAKEKDIEVNVEDFQNKMKKHQELSRTASVGKFKSGLADDSKETTCLHTAAHLLLAALKKVLGTEVIQKGSNITAERLRFDFSWGEKMTDEQKTEVEKIVNEAIQQNIPVECNEMSIEEAKKQGASGIFDDKYGDVVKVYKIGDFSQELCSGPHVENTEELGRFKITKEESSSAGVRRIKAVLE
ncbi:MAG: alanine--tRNA ligase [Candidatus Pacebacteria bacterium]|nr:alanine--tRNA ligase [Candidatus Paceibacterota bacterium]